MNLLRLLHKVPIKLRKDLVKKSDDDVVKCLCECAYNILRGNVKLTDKDKRTAKRYKTQLCRLCKPKLALNTKRKILVQSGGTLGAILGPLIGLVGTLLLGAIRK